MADGKYLGLPLEQRIGSISDGEVTNFGPAIRSTRLTVQPTRKSDMTDNEITEAINDLRASSAHDHELLLRAADALDAVGLFPEDGNDE